ncbi:hypothetical protein PP641_gp091 [Arthrobacter phage SilentRX]|uniref:Uncharacterized protein n=1 Tax=Arthrobacter phage SilentRX TaxID=2836091 RepID=A0A8F3E7H6_9CAUD|nr:hypothetical protein PP641_gp091 [Arthrobacter phage SilentRX]QWY82831.1 hypothetical protein SEA_SILENTRX_91 [Arthrobacter phage SilentRX]
MTDHIVTHHMGNGLTSPCGLEPAAVYSGLQAGFATDWALVNCPVCLEHPSHKPGVGEPTPLQTFYVTFGMMYRHEKHPFWTGAHPDGWLEVQAPDEDAARELVRRYIGNRYAFIYDKLRFDPKWHPLGALASIKDGAAPWYAPHVPHFGPPFTTSDCRYYGFETSEVVAARIEGELAKDSDADAIRELGYEAELVHKHCLTEGLALFKRVIEVDSRVMAGELDYADPHECPVCETSIT